MCKCANVQMCEWSLWVNVQMCKCANGRLGLMCKCANVQMCEWLPWINVQMCEWSPTYAVIINYD